MKRQPYSAENAMKNNNRNKVDKTTHLPVFVYSSKPLYINKMANVTTNML